MGLSYFASDFFVRKEEAIKLERGRYKVQVWLGSEKIKYLSILCKGGIFMKIPVRDHRPALELKYIKLYSTGRKGKRFTDHFYKTRNHNFEVEILIQNNTANQQNVKVGGSVFQ